MADSRLARVAAWAAAVTPATLPADVRRRAARLQLSTAAAVRAADLDVGSTLLDGRAGRDGLVATVERSVARDYDDFGLWGHPGAAAAGAWAASVDTERTLVATAVGAEVMARLGTWTMLSPTPAHARAWLTSAGVAAAIAHARGLDARGFTHALALALANPVELEAHELRSVGARTRRHGDAAGAGFDAVVRARDGELGDEGLLDGDDGLVGALPTPAPFGRAFEDLDGWITRSLVHRQQPLAPWLQTPFQAFHEILRRHQKAASKRLRADQVDRIEVRIDHLAWGRAREDASVDGLPDDGHLPYALPIAIGTLVATHEHGPALFDRALLDANRDAILDVAAKVDLRPDLGHTLRRVRGLARALGPLLADVPVATRLSLATSIVQKALRGLPSPDRLDLRGILRDDPVDALRGLLDPPAEVGAGPVHVPNATFVRLYTSRGGWWPERRDVIEGGPEYSASDLDRDVVAKFGRCVAWKAGAIDATALQGAVTAARRFLDAPPADGALALLAP